jgi:transposase
VARALRKPAEGDSNLESCVLAELRAVFAEVRRLMTVPGVNLICAATFIAAIGYADRFLTSRKLVAYLGLDPKVRQSG